MPTSIIAKALMPIDCKLMVAWDAFTKRHPPTADSGHVGERWWAFCQGWEAAGGEMPEGFK